MVPTDQLPRVLDLRSRGNPDRVEHRRRRQIVEGRDSGPFPLKFQLLALLEGRLHALAQGPDLRPEVRVYYGTTCGAA